MRVRTISLSALALGILIGAGGCSSESPTSPLAPGTISAAKGGYMGGVQRDTTRSSVSGGYMGGVMGRGADGEATISGGYMGGVQ
ncbi:MAG TPA: hypothetical protein VF647_20710 [Longimicrobium sp.]|jgi:hypothetical protein